jgi:hypothetical protein
MAVCSRTLGAVYGKGPADKIASLEVDKLTDSVVLDRDLFGIDPHDIHEAGVLLTIATAGRYTARTVVHGAKGTARQSECVAAAQPQDKNTWDVLNASLREQATGVRCYTKSKLPKLSENLILNLINNTIRRMTQKGDLRCTSE